VDHLELRPEAREAGAELGAEEGFVVCDDGAYATTIRDDGASAVTIGYDGASAVTIGGGAAPAIHAGTSMEATTPCGAFSSSTRWAADP